MTACQARSQLTAIGPGLDGIGSTSRSQIILIAGPQYMGYRDRGASESGPTVALTEDPLRSGLVFTLSLVHISPRICPSPTSSNVPYWIEQLDAEPNISALGRL